MVQDPQLARLKSSLHQAELNRNAASERGSRFRRSARVNSRQKNIQPARITECPQNAVELRKLINTWTDLDKAQKKSLSKLNSAQFNLKLEYNELLSGNTSDSGVNLLLPPGFRYHANGEPKRGKSLVQVSHLREKEHKTGSESDIGSHLEKMKKANETSLNESPTKTDIDQEIRNTEIALEEIKNDRQLQAISRKISQMKDSIKYLRAHSANDLSTRREWSSSQKNPGLRRKYSVSPTKTPTISQNEARPGFLRGTVSSENKRLNTKRFNSGIRSVNLSKEQKNASTDTPSSSPAVWKKSGENGSASIKADNNVSSTGVRKGPSKSASHLSKRNYHTNKEEQDLIPKQENKIVRSSQGEYHSMSAKELQRRGTQGKKLHKRLSIDELKCSKNKRTWRTFTSELLNEGDSELDNLNNSDSDDADSDDTLLKISTEEKYRQMMRRSSITDEQKLSKLSEMMNGVAIGTKRKNSSKMCHLNARQKLHHRQSSGQLVQGDKNNLAALKSMVELETKSSKAKVKDFLNRLPTPDVTIRRWRTSKGDMQVIERRCEAENEEDKNTEKVEEKSPVENQSEEGDESDSDHASVSTNLSVDGSDNSEKLAINTALTSWPTHWAQRAAFFKQFSPDVSPEKNEEKDPEKEFRKLLRCRYLRIPSRMLKRNSSVLSTTSTQAWK